MGLLWKRKSAGTLAGAGNGNPRLKRYDGVTQARIVHDDRDVHGTPAIVGEPQVDGVVSVDLARACPRARARSRRRRSPSGRSERDEADQAGDGVANDVETDLHECCQWKNYMIYAWARFAIVGRLLRDAAQRSF
jgi:hypothetical protein